MSNPITRESLISPNVDKVAISKETMYVVGEDEESIVEVPMLESIKSSGIIPEEYANFIWTQPVISALAKNNVTTIEQLTDGMLAEMRKVMNAANNVSISPRYVVENIRKAMENALEMEGSDEESEEGSQGNIGDDECDNTNDEHE